MQYRTPLEISSKQLSALIEANDHKQANSEMSKIIVEIINTHKQHSSRIKFSYRPNENCVCDRVATVAHKSRDGVRGNQARAASCRAVIGCLLNQRQRRSCTPAASFPTFRYYVYSIHQIIPFVKLSKHLAQQLAAATATATRLIWIRRTDVGLNRSRPVAKPHAFCFPDLSMHPSIKLETVPTDCRFIISHVQLVSPRTV